MKYEEIRKAVLKVEPKVGVWGFGMTGSWGKADGLSEMMRFHVEPHSGTQSYLAEIRSETVG